VRPVNAALVLVSVLLGAAVAGAQLDAPGLWGAAVGAAFLAAAGYAWNDLADVARDRVNKPWRPLASGRAARCGAISLAAGAGATGLALLFLAGRVAGALGMAWVAVLALYETAAKSRGAWGNFLVASVCATPFLLGGVAVGRPGPSVVPVLLAFLFHMGRELWKDASDAAGDAPTGLLTFAVRRSPGMAVRTGGGFFLLLVLLTPIPYLLGVYNAAYLAVALLGVDLLLVPLVAGALCRPTAGFATRYDGLLKLGMAAGLCAISLGAI
jgi:geranylgeranylglycerol-phosphate geranylgeranyltransferase